MRWHRIFMKEFRYQFFSDALNKNYAKEQQQSKMLLFFTVLAIVIAMMGVLWPGCPLYRATDQGNWHP